MRSYMVALALLFIAIGHLTYAQTEQTTTEAPDDGDLLPVFRFDVNRPFTLNCSPSDVAPANVQYSWSVNGTAVEDVPALKGRFVLEEGGNKFRLIARAHEDDFGNYTCSVGGDFARGWRVHARPIARLTPNSNVVEGQKLKITCKLIGKPYPPVVWTYAPDDTTNQTEVGAALGGRALLQDSAAGVPGGDLLLEAAARSDAGVFRCAPADGEGSPAATVLRVKDMYAALWPFLGICLEVFVLCAIILVYEKRRTKPELDDSDTDNHEQ